MVPDLDETGEVILPIEEVLNKLEPAYFEHGGTQPSVNFNLLSEDETFERELGRLVYKPPFGDFTVKI